VEEDEEVPMEEAEVEQAPLTLEVGAEDEEEIEVQDLTVEDDYAMDVHVHVEGREAEEEEEERQQEEEGGGKEEEVVHAKAAVTVTAEVDRVCGEAELDTAEFTNLEDCRVQ
jgi:hypothetical protein